MNTSKNIAAKIVLIVLIVLVSIFDVFWLIGTLGVALEQNQDGTINTDYISYMKLTGEPYLEEIGSQYEGNAQAGYTYYRVHVPVLSAGTTELSAEYDLYLEAEGEDYSDVQSYYESYDEDQEDIFTYSNVEILPPGQEGELTEILQIKDGVSEISLTVYPTSQDYYNETNGYETRVTVP